MILPRDQFQLAIEEHDFMYPCDSVGRRNILIHDIKPLNWSEIPEVSASLVKPGLSNASELRSFGLMVRPHELREDPVIIRCLHQQFPLFDNCSGIVALENVFVEHIRPLILVADEETVIYQHSSGKSNELVVFDYCCGGFGGWAMATKMLQCWHNLPILKTIGIDFDHRALQNWATTHEASYVETLQIPWASFQMIKGNIGLVADVNSRHWRQAVMAMSPNIWCISAPCISWSGAGKLSGFHSSDGIVLLIGLGMARMARPRILLIEQVKHFEQHDHYPLFIRLITWAGYKLIYRKVHEAGDHGPMLRPRWLGFAVDLLSSDDFDMSKYHPDWLGPMNLHPFNFGCDWRLEENFLKGVKVGPNVLAKYFDHKLAPSVMKGRLSQKRSSKWNQQMPVLMANYGSQHLLDEGTLKSKGLYGHFLEENCRLNHCASYLRWWHPIELAVMFFPFRYLTIPQDLKLSWKILGNAIASNHAIFALATMLPLMSDQLSLPKSDQILHELLTKRLTSNNGIIQDLGKVWIVGEVNHSQIVKPEIERFFSVVHSEVGSMQAGWYYQWGQGSISLHVLARNWMESRKIPPAIDITPTCVHGWIALQVFGPNYMSVAMIQSGMMLENVLSFGEGFAKCGFNDDPNNRSHFQTLVISGDFLPDHGNHKHVVIAYVSDEAWIQEIVPGIRMQDCTDQHGLPSADFNAFGRLHDNHCISSSTILFHDLPPIEKTDISPVVLGTACCFSESKIVYDVEHDMAHIIFRLQDDSTTDWKVMSHLWNSSQHVWWGKVGRNVTIRTDELQEHIHVAISPFGNIMPLPLKESIAVFMTAGMKALLTSFSNLPGITMIPVKLKWLNVICWEGSLPDFFDPSFLKVAVGFFLSPLNQQQEINFICHGKQICNVTLGELSHQRTQDGKQALLTIIAQPMISGGGGSGPSKKDWDVNIRNQLAAALLPHGVNVAMLPQMTETILRHHGRPKVQQMLKSVSEDQKAETLIQLSHQAGFQIQAQSFQPPKPQQGQKKLRVDKVREELNRMDLDGISIEPGFLIDAHGKSLGQLQTIIPKATGIVIAKEHQIRSWLLDEQQISPDPLAVFLVGCNVINTKLPHEHICLPTRDAQSRPLLLSGTLVQLGQEPVIFSPKKDQKEPEEDTCMVSITAWKEECDDEHWNEIIKSPFRAFHNLVETHGEGIKILASWGISCHQNSKPCQRQIADSIQFHATIPSEAVHRLLRLSGIAGTYMVPKNPQGGAMEDWRVIWISTPIKQTNAHTDAMRLLSKLDDPAGLVRSKSNYGIRVKQSDYNKSFASIRPTDPIPDDVHGKQFFKLTPFPFGTSPDSIRLWLQSEKWEGFPVKPLGPQTWLVAAKEAPQASFLTYNGHPILVRSMPNKSQKPLTPLVAGGKLPTLQDTKNPMSNEMAPLRNDPWAQYTPTASIKPATSQVTSAAPTTGFVQQKLQQQDDRISSLAEDLKKMKSSQVEMGSQLEQKVNKVSQAVEDTKQSFSSQLSQLQKDLESSLHGALQSQNSSISAGFLELKNMMQQQGNDRRSTSHRRNREEMQSAEDADM